MNYPKNLLESTELTVAKASDEMLAKKDAYTEERGKFYDSAEPWKWSGMYKHGVNGMGPDAEKFIDSIFRPKPTIPKIEE